MDPTSLAHHLTMLEFRLYTKVKPHECMQWVKTQSGPSVQNLLSFCETHEKLASWVKQSVLGNDSLGKRADAVDFWIKVAEVRRRGSYSLSCCKLAHSCRLLIEMPLDQ
jgi:son of sevenless-like protein